MEERRTARWKERARREGGSEGRRAEEGGKAPEARPHHEILKTIRQAIRYL